MTLTSTNFQPPISMAIAWNCTTLEILNWNAPLSCENMYTKMLIVATLIKSSYLNAHFDFPEGNTAFAIRRKKKIRETFSLWWQLPILSSFWISYTQKICFSASWRPLAWLLSTGLDTLPLFYYNIQCILSCNHLAIFSFRFQVPWDQVNIFWDSVPSISSTLKPTWTNTGF